MMSTCQLPSVIPPCCTQHRQGQRGATDLGGIDNETFDFQQLEDFITSNEDICFPEDAIPAISCRDNNRLPADTCQNNQNTYKQFNTVLDSQSHTTDMYCPQTTAPQMNSSYKSPHYLPTNLPDSPPDSEPYSPPDGHQNPSDSAKRNHSINANPHLPVSIETTVADSIPVSQMYPTHNRLPVSKAMQGYMGNSEPPKLNHQPPTAIHHNIPQHLNPQLLPPHFGSMNNIAAHQMNKKRRLTDSPTNSINAAMMNGMNGMNHSSMNGGVLTIKQEPPANYPGFPLPECGDGDDYSFDIDSGTYLDGSYQIIKWQPYQQNKWTVLANSDLKDLPPPTYRVDADKGFNFSTPDDSFVCQKKNHFQVTVHIGISGNPKYVRTPDGVKRIDSFYLHFNGVKMESQTQFIKIEQSQSDRSKKSFHPVKLDLAPDQVTKLTVGRLHFSETTSNNMRKKGKPNPDQRYFLLVVGLHAHCNENDYLIAAATSERIIVRASNPGQFENDVDVLWQKGHTQESVYHVGRVGVNTDHPEEALTVHGNMKLTGALMQVSDIRAKENLKETNPKEQLKNVQNIKLYNYQYSRDFAEAHGIEDEHRKDTGVVAQDLIEVLPDAVRETGDVLLPNGRKIENFLVVNKDRIFMENVGAVKELCKLTDNLEVRIDELEGMSKKLSKLKRFDSLKSNISTKSTSSSISSISQQKSRHINSKHDHSCSKSSRSQPSNKHGWCSNRFIQITIIILILIMAFCLVAITILYILERHKEQTTTHSPYVQSHGHISSSGHRPMTSPTAQSKSGLSTKSQSEHRTGPSTLAPVTQGRKHAPSRIPVPTMCNQHDCEELCCPPPFGEIDPITMGPNESGGKGPDYSGVIPQISDDALSRHVVIDHSFMNDSSMNDEPMVINNGDNYPNEVKYQIIRNRRKRDLPQTSIVLKELNFTVGQQYCYSADHCSRRNSSYIVPLSPKFTYDQVTVYVRAPENMYTYLCLHKERFRCQATNSINTTIVEVTNPVDGTREWKVAFAVFYHYTFKFRITEVENPQVCSISADEQDMSFMEQTVLFYRTCMHNGEK